jgi:RNA polymerase sigma-70 factor (ECF subfamily)
MSESAFQVVYEITNKSLWAYIYKLVNDNALTDDLFQESYIRLLKADVDGLDEQKTRAYLFTIATNMVRDYWRREKRLRNWFEREPDMELSKSSGQDIHTQIDVNDAFQQLSIQHRSLLWLAHVEGYEHREIAQMLKLNEKSIRVLLFRAKKKFIEILQHFGITTEVEHEHS